MIGRRRFGVVVVAALALTAGVVTLGITKPAPEEPSLEIVVSEVLVEDAQFSATVAVFNPDPLRHELEVWLTLGAFGVGDGWSRRVAETSSQDIAVRSGEQVELTWDEAVAMPKGWYEVTAWARLEGRAGQVHQATGTTGVQVDESASMSRVSFALNGDHISDVDLQLEGGTFASLNGTVTAAVDGRSPSLKIDLLNPESDVPWWAQPAAETFLIDTLSTNATTAEASLAKVLPLPAGSYRLRLELLSEGIVVDQVLLLDQFTIDPIDPSIRRDAPPVGAVALVSVSIPDEWSDPASRVVTVVAQNLEPFTVDAKFWWLLAAPGDPSPWEFPDARSFEVSRRFEPFETRTIRLAPSGDMRPGLGFELSIWTHTIDELGESAHSDGLRLSALIDMPLAPAKGE